MLDASEALGDAATDIVMSKLLPNAKQLPSDIPGKGESGQFDRVYIQGDMIYIVESKGGSSDLGSRKDLNGEQSQQGTPEYIASVIQNMSDKVDAGLVDPRYGVDEEFTNQIDGLETTVTKLRIAQSSTPPKITSLQISQRVDSNGDLPPSIEAKKFENFSVKAVGAANTNP
ncbi:MAG: hypothetical protein IPP17_14625 [Bacteroidetes bacterium]|nr:hypothetical protein [Bacteroidota bacterium]